MKGRENLTTGPSGEGRKDGCRDEACLVRGCRAAKNLTPDPSPRAERGVARREMWAGG